jgi:hypothetical protein
MDGTEGAAGAAGENNDGGAAAVAIAAAAAGATGGDGSGGDGGQSGADWRTAITDEALRADPTIANYKSLDDLVNGHKSTKALASSKVPMPGETPESQQAFMDALRPADAAVYDITVPEGYKPEFAEGFRAKAHELALQPWQAKAIADWNNEFYAAEAKAQSDASEAEVSEFKKSYGSNYNAQLGKVGLMLQQAGLQLSEEDLGELDVKLGSANLLRFMFDMADRVGPLEQISGDDNPGMNGGVAAAQADGILKEKQTNPEWRKNALVSGTPEQKEYERLTRLVAQDRHAQQQRGKTA